MEAAHCRKRAHTAPAQFQSLQHQRVSCFLTAFARLQRRPRTVYTDRVQQNVDLAQPGGDLVRLRHSLHKRQQRSTSLRNLHLQCVLKWDMPPVSHQCNEVRANPTRWLMTAQLSMLQPASFPRWWLCKAICVHFPSLTSNLLRLLCPLLVLSMICGLLSWLGAFQRATAPWTRKFGAAWTLFALSLSFILHLSAMPAWSAENCLLTQSLAFHRTLA